MNSIKVTTTALFLAAMMTGCASTPSGSHRASLRVPATETAAATVALPSVEPLPRAAWSVSPERSSNLALGVEVQAYPAGIIPGLHAEWALDEHSVLTARLAANITDRQDYGEHDDEKGDGFGGGIGYRHFFGEDLAGWLLGARVDLWDLEIDWRDDAPTSTSGTTDVLVLQPTIEGGYGFRAPGSRWRLDATLSVGAEINIDSRGEDVGEGAIALLGVTATYGF